MEQQNINNLIPAHPIHPGIILNRELKERGIKQREFANEIGIAPTQLNEIIKGKRNISAETSLLIEASIGVEAITWLNLQSMYEIDTARENEEFKKRTELLTEWKKIKGLIPFSFLKKEKIITNDQEKNIKTIFDFYNVRNTEELVNEVNFSESSRFRKSPVRQVNNINLAGWVKYVEYQARHKKVKPFKAGNKEKLIIELRKALLQKNILVNMDKILAQHGIIFIVQPKLDKVPVDGIATWGKKNPIVAVSLRYKRLDNLAFTLFHEIAHVFLHLLQDKGGEPFIDDLEAKGEEREEETEANIFAEDNLIPRAEWKMFLSQNYNFSSENIIKFSNQIDIHPAITLGRLKKEYNEFYRRRFSISNQII